MSKLQGLKKGEARFKVGQSYWELSLYEGTAEWNEWVLRSIRYCYPKTVRAETRKNYGSRWAYFTRKLKDVTWVKKSKKHGDWGWAENAPDWCKAKAYVHEALRVDAPDERYQLPYGVYSTKLQAAKFALRESEMAVIECLMEASKALSVDKADWLEESKAERRNVAAAKRVIKKLTKENGNG